MAEINNSLSRTRKEQVNDLRFAIEHRATWFYLLWEEATKKGLDWEEFARPAIFKCGCIQGEKIKSICTNPESLKDFEMAFANNLVKEIFDMEVKKSTDDELEIHFHYCPLVVAWQKLGCGDEAISLLCDIAMDGDRGIVSNFDTIDFTLGETIAQGHPVCKLYFKSKINT
jgi:hypothetical protein